MSNEQACFYLAFLIILVGFGVKLIINLIRHYKDKIQAYHIKRYANGEIYVLSDTKMYNNYGFLGKGKINDVSQPEKEYQAFNIEPSEEQNSYLFMFCSFRFVEYSWSPEMPNEYIPVSGCKVLASSYCSKYLSGIQQYFRRYYYLIEGSSDFVVKIAKNNGAFSEEHYINGILENSSSREHKKKYEDTK